MDHYALVTTTNQLVKKVLSQSTRCHMVRLQTDKIRTTSIRLLLFKNTTSTDVTMTLPKYLLILLFNYLHA
jgi:hypothetical protein